MRFYRTFQFWGLRKAVRAVLDEIFHGRDFTLFFLVKPQYKGKARQMVCVLLQDLGFEMEGENNYNGRLTEGYTTFRGDGYDLCVADSYHIDFEVDHLIPQLLFAGRCKNQRQLRAALEKIEALDFWIEIDCEWHP